MASGQKKEIFNTRERALSADLNRLQAFAGFNLAEALRYMLSVGSNDDSEAGAVATEYAGVTAPARAEVLGGLMVRPQNGSLALTVDAGHALVIAPDGSPDDSNYKLVVDPGVAAIGALVMTANASGSTRIDVVECQPSTSVLENDSRDIFDPVTGLFTPASVTKVTAGRMTYRVRAGTPGSGYPGAASGWLPLAVVSVPNGATNNDAMTFWDVRPLVNDRELGVMGNARSLPRVERAIAKVNYSDYTATARMNGVVEATYGGRRVGGRMRRGTPGTDAEYLELLAAANGASGSSALVADGFWHVYLMVPFDLPRWARYTDSAAGARVPRSPRGIPVLSTVAPVLLTGAPSANITLPTSTGMDVNGGMTTGVCVFSGFSGSVGGTKLRDHAADGRVVWTTGDANNQPTKSHDISTANQVEWVLVPGTHFPHGARAIHVELTLSVAFAASEVGMITANFFMRGNGGVAGGASGSALTVALAGQGGSLAMNALGGGGVTISSSVRVPVVPEYPSTTLDHVIVCWKHSEGTHTFTGTARVVGWELGP